MNSINQSACSLSFLLGTRKIYRLGKPNQSSWRMDCQAGAVESLAPSFGGATGKKNTVPSEFQVLSVYCPFPVRKMAIFWRTAKIAVLDCSSTIITVVSMLKQESDSLKESRLAPWGRTSVPVVKVLSREASDNWRRWWDGFKGDTRSGYIPSL